MYWCLNLQEENCLFSNLHPCSELEIKKRNGIQRSREAEVDSALVWKRRWFRVTSIWLLLLTLEI